MFINVILTWGIGSLTSCYVGYSLARLVFQYVPQEGFVSDAISCTVRALSGVHEG